jgi:hypothetical protein
MSFYFSRNCSKMCFYFSRNCSKMCFYFPNNCLKNNTFSVCELSNIYCRSRDDCCSSFQSTFCCFRKYNTQKSKTRLSHLQPPIPLNNNLSYCILLSLIAVYYIPCPIKRTV